jgi:hypothetical protein
MAKILLRILLEQVTCRPQISSIKQSASMLGLAPRSITTIKTIIRKTP